MYKVIKAFADLQDGNHTYSVGDRFPRCGVEVGKERIAELSGRENKQGVPLIKLVEDEEPVKEEKKPAKRGRKPAKK
jgi:hypothetical protein